MNEKIQLRKKPISNEVDCANWFYVLTMNFARNKSHFMFFYGSHRPSDVSMLLSSWKQNRLEFFFFSSSFILPSKLCFVSNEKKAEHENQMNPKLACICWDVFFLMIFKMKKKMLAPSTKRMFMKWACLLSICLMLMSSISKKAKSNVCFVFFLVFDEPLDWQSIGFTKKSVYFFFWTEQAPFPSFFFFYKL